MKRVITRFIGRWWSVGLAAILCVLWQIEVWTSTVPNRPLLVAAGILGPAIFAFAAWHPFAATALSLVPLATCIWFDAKGSFDVDAMGLLVLVGACVFGAQCAARERLVGLAIALSGVLWLVVRVPEASLQAQNLSRTTVALSNGIIFLVAWAVSWVISARLRETRALRARALELEETSRARAEAAVAEERGRIARELHDVVAHSVSVMVVQAGGVRRLLTADQAREREALTTVEETGRRALAEMRRMVGVMRGDGPGLAAREPQPGLARLDRLVAEIRDAGLPVDLAIDGTPVALPPGIDLSAYRIVQEALTNTLKHAGPARARVLVRYRADAVELDVSDDGHGGASTGGAGHGLIGIRERVSVYGGTFEAGPLPDGGFSLRATLPMDAAPAPTEHEAIHAD